jgi:hypothetical protein
LSQQHIRVSEDTEVVKYVKLQNDKSQFPNSKQMPMTEIQNLKQVWVIDNCNFEFIWYLVLVIWDELFRTAAPK